MTCYHLPGTETGSFHQSAVQIDNDYVIVRRLSKFTSVRIALHNIVSCSKSSKEDRVTLNYTKYSSKNEMVLAKQIINGKPDLIKIFHGEMGSKLKILTACRPRRLLVFINPFAGTSKAAAIFQQIKPIFDCADVKYKAVVTTERGAVKNHIMESKELYTYDGVVAIGGDGTIHDIVNSLMTRCQRDLRVDFNNPAIPHIPCLVPIGIIPAGTYNALVRFIHGTIDPTTAALHVILGRQVRSNVYSIHQGGKLTTYSALRLGLGMIANSVQMADDLRCLGRYRYDFAFLMNLLRNPECLKLKISYKQPALFGGGIGRSEQEWKNIEGEFRSVGSTLYNLTGNGSTSEFHFGENYCRMILAQRCSRKHYYSFVEALKRHKKRAFEYDFVKCIQIKAARIDVTEQLDIESDRLIMCCDGEIIYITSNQIDIRLHPRAISIFGCREQIQ